MLAGRAEDFLSPNYFLFLVVAFLPHLGPPRGRGRGRDRTALLRQGTQRLGPSSPDTPDSHLPRWFCEKWVRMGKMGFFRHLGPPGGRGRGRDRTALLGQGTQGVGPSSPDTPDTHLPRWWGEKWGKNWGKMGENGEKWGFCVIWGPRGAWSGSGSHCPSRAGYPGGWAIFPQRNPNPNPSRSRAGDFPHFPHFSIFFSKYK